MASPKDAQLSERLDKIYAEHAGTFSTVEEEELFIADKEFQALAECNLGLDYDPEKIRRGASLQRDLQITRIELDRDLDAGRIKPDEFLVDFNGAIARIFAECERVLGEKDFERLFGASLEETKSLIDPSIFLAHSKPE